ncbi:Uncharacterised protein [Burkholderia pseudomallei]|nr:Uncharacterised protein [Burkholderia pseudomallei]
MVGPTLATILHSVETVPATRLRAVVIDREKNIAKYEPLAYIQSAEVSDAGDMLHSAFTFSFRDFANPSMQIRVNRLRAEDTSARIRYALEHAA